jgi:hypothetical protein
MKVDCAATNGYTQETYYAYYTCFTTICDLFTDSPVRCPIDVTDQNWNIGNDRTSQVYKKIAYFYAHRIIGIPNIWKSQSTA